MSLQTSIKDIRDAQRANLRALAAVKGTGLLGRVLRWGVGEGHRHAIPSTPHDTGTLRAAHRIRGERGGLRWRVFIDPAAVNPRYGGRPAVYGPELHKQGFRPGLRSGIRAFYAFTVDRYGTPIGRDMGLRFVGRMR